MRRDAKGLRTVLGMLLVLALLGCAAGTARRAEAVFRDHNDLVSALMLEWEQAEDERRRELLEHAEADLVAACAPLNRAAADRRDGQRVEGRLAIAASIDRCACRNRQVRSLLAGDAVQACPGQ